MATTKDTEETPEPPVSEAVPVTAESAFTNAAVGLVTVDEGAVLSNENVREVEPSLRPAASVTVTVMS